MSTTGCMGGSGGTRNWTCKVIKVAVKYIYTWLYELEVHGISMVDEQKLNGFMIVHVDSTTSARLPANSESSWQWQHVHIPNGKMKHCWQNIIIKDVGWERGRFLWRLGRRSSDHEPFCAPTDNVQATTQARHGRRTHSRMGRVRGFLVDPP